MTSYIENNLQGPVRFAASGTLDYTRVWLLQERGNKTTTGVSKQYAVPNTL